VDALEFGEDELSGLIPKTSFNVITMVVDCGNVMIWVGISPYGKTNLNTENETQNSQHSCKGIVIILEFVPFLNHGQVTIIISKR
jgi:hypothetical protein